MVLVTIAACLLGFASCSRQDAEPAKNTPKKSQSALTEVKVEIRENGLAYLPGATEPFSGDAVQLHDDRTPRPLAWRTPYQNGLKHGVVTSYTSGGKLREERLYEKGIPVSTVVYHGNGQKKFELLLNKNGKAEGPYKRWHDNGVLQAESAFDSEERFHGEEKDYDREGKLIGHYRNVHGILTEIIFETSEMKQERLIKMGLAPAPSKTPVSQ